MSDQFVQSKKSNLLVIYILLGLLLHLVSSFFSIGFYSDDEHFQILEPTAYLLGLNEIIIDDPTGYYWEWESWVRMRPWFQPYIYYNIINILKFIGLSDPFSWSFLLRLLSSILGYLSIIYLFFTTKEEFFKKNNHFNYLLFFSFWFYPFLHSRTSAENLSTTLFIFAFCFLYKKINLKNINYFYLFFFSIIMGLGLVSKFNLIFTVLPFFVWIFFFRFNFNRILLIGLGIIFALIIGLYIDYLNWGSFRNTYYQFYKHNIVTGTLDVFGTQPWWFYFTSTIAELAPLLSVFFVISLMIFWLKNPKNIFTWITFFTVLSFSFFGHKETRYIFIVYFFAPFFIAYFFETYPKIKFAKLFKTLIILSNIIFLLLTLFTPANSKVAVYKYLYKNHNYGEKVFYVNSNPYLVNDMEAFFYTKFIPEIEELKEENLKNKKVIQNNWIVTNDITKYKIIINSNNHCQKKYSSYPESLVNLNKNWKRLKFNWYIIYCN